MAVFVELVTDAFEEVLATQKRSKQNDARTSGAGRKLARRPTRGLEIKDDTYAIIKLIRVDGREIPLIDSSSPDGETTSGYANFILQSVQEARMEKFQIVETFGDSYIFFFGESPRFLDVTAVILNSHDFNWEAEWWENYNRYIRGTKSVELGARTYLFYDDNIVEGYILMAQATKMSDQPLMLQLTFRFFITNYQNISFIGDPNFPIRSSAQIPPGIELTSGNAGSALIDKFRNAARDVILQNGGDPAASSISSLVGNGLPAGRKISELLRAASPSFGISPDTWAEIQGLQVDGAPLADNLRELAERTGRPIRGLIAENIDEFAGAPPEMQMRGAGRYLPAPGEPLSALAPQVRKQWESADLFKDSIQFLSCFGAYINQPRTMISLGLGVRFGVSAGIGPTFRPAPAPAYGFGPTEQVGLSSRQSFGQFQRDPLGAVFGQARAQVGVFATQNPDPRNRYTFGGGDPGYGYPSDFATGPGYGVPGFGDMGGLGFGCGCGAGGDPGYRDPNKFTFGGVADERSAFTRFLLPKPDPTALGRGFGFGPGVGVGVAVGVSGGASVSIGGKPSPFAMVALPGTLDETGNARHDPFNVSALLARSRIGFTNPNPFGVHCPSPGLRLSTGIRVSLP
jgi:hypothetical protein